MYMHTVTYIVVCVHVYLLTVLCCISLRQTKNGYGLIQVKVQHHHISFYVSNHMEVLHERKN